MRVINPPTVVQPASAYAQAVCVTGPREKLFISGQVGLRPDGTLAQGYEAQARQAWTNIFALLEAAGMARTDLLSVRVYDLAPGNVAAYRAIRDEMLGGFLVACTYVVVVGLASPGFLTEIEAEAVKA